MSSFEKNIKINKKYKKALIIAGGYNKILINKGVNTKYKGDEK